MHKHFFTFKKLVNGQPTTPAIYLDVIVELPKKNQTEAREIAEAEMRQWQDGFQLVKDRVQEERAESYADIRFRFVGVA